MLSVYFDFCLVCCSPSCTELILSPKVIGSTPPHNFLILHRFPFLFPCFLFFTFSFLIQCFFFLLHFFLTFIFSVELSTVRIILHSLLAFLSFYLKYLSHSHCQQLIEISLFFFGLVNYTRQDNLLPDIVLLFLVYLLACFDR